MENLHSTMPHWVTTSLTILLLISCKDFGTKDHYTNQHLRSTAITMLGRLGYGNKQIMSVSGHEPSTSLEIYQRVNDPEKMGMGKDLGKALLKCKISKPGPNKNATSTEIANATVSTDQNQIAVQYIEKGNIHNEIPGEPEDPIPSKCPMIQAGPSNQMEITVAVASTSSNLEATNE